MQSTMGKRWDRKAPELADKIVETIEKALLESQGVDSESPAMETIDRISRLCCAVFLSLMRDQLSNSPSNIDLEDVFAYCIKKHSDNLIKMSKRF